MSFDFIKMSGIGNDFIIFDAREKNLNLSTAQIIQFSDRKFIGCDQLIVIKNSDEADCLMEIYNSDGSLSGACGNATRCVAAILFAELNKKEVIIKTAAGILRCWQQEKNLISVNMGKPKFAQEKFSLLGFEFDCVDVGNPHAVCFVTENLSDEKFFKLGPAVEQNQFFPNKTNVEFAKIISDDLIEVRVWERGAGETLACGSGACAVGALAIKNSLITKNETCTRFKGGDLYIKFDLENVIMTGSYQKNFIGKIL